MLKRSFIRWSSCWLLVMASSGYVSAQTLEETVASADQAFAEEDYLQSLTEYQRAWLFSESDSLHAYIFDRIAHSHSMLDHPEQAIYYKELAYKNATGEARSRLILEAIPWYVSVKQYSKALRALIGTPTFSDEMRDEKNLYLGILYFQLSNFEQAANYFNRVATDTASINRQLSSKKLHRPKEKVAKALSYVLPGAGQYYAGDLKNGLSSTAIVGAIVYVGINIFQRYTWYNAFIAAGPLFQRYYLGGVKNAGDVALKRQFKNRKKVLMTILEQIRNERL